MILLMVRYWTRFVTAGSDRRPARDRQRAFGGRVTGKARSAQGAGKRSRRPGFAMVRYIDAGGDEHYAGLAEAASVPFENGRMARNIPAHRDIAHTPGASGFRQSLDTHHKLKEWPFEFLVPEQPAAG